MDAAEIEQLISDLETQVERLRALYEQYFMGIERIEPLVMRKEVDRRLWMLRREQIRNTGLRFKLQTTIQRYNTYQQYWQRIVREIENGTYQRDLGRAAQRFGDSATTALGRRRQKMFEKGMAKRAERDAQRRRSSAPPASDEASGVSIIPSLPSPPNDMVEITFQDSEMFGSSPPPAPALELEMEAEVEVPRPAAVPTPAPSPRHPSAPPPRPSPRVPSQATSATAPGPANGGPPRALPLRRPPGAPTAPASPPALDALPRAAAPAHVVRPVAAAAPVPIHAAPAAMGSAPTSPIVRQPPAAAPPPALAHPAPNHGTPNHATAPKPAGDEPLSATRMRQIYGQYVEAKRKANESTAAITYDKIAATLKESANALRAKHQGRSVDFEVVMRNGKPILKPIVKG